jgi:hypothetical protein
MTEEEKQKRLRYLQLKAKAGAAGPKEKVEDPDAPSELESGLEGAKQGLTFGFADELQGGFGALLDTITGLGDEQAAILGEEYDSGENYRGLRDAAREDVEAAQAANPKSFLAGELAGALLVPGGAAGGGAKGLAKAATKGVRGPSPSTLLRATGRGAAEGALYGAGTAEEMEDVARGAVGGGLAGGGASAALGGLGKTMRFLNKKRIDEDLVNEAGEFTPIHLADREGRLGDIYRNTIGRSFGGKQTLQAQVL